jgi:hypothetical protein
MSINASDLLLYFAEKPEFHSRIPQTWLKLFDTLSYRTEDSTLRKQFIQFTGQALKLRTTKPAPVTSKYFLNLRSCTHIAQILTLLKQSTLDLVQLSKCISDLHAHFQTNCTSTSKRIPVPVLYLQYYKDVVCFLNIITNDYTDQFSKYLIQLWIHDYIIPFHAILHHSLLTT